MTGPVIAGRAGQPPRGATTPGPVTARILLPDQSAIRASGLVCRRGRATVLDELDITVPRSICFGLAGRPGSGKSTLLAAAATLERPAGASCRCSASIRATRSRSAGTSVTSLRPSGCRPTCGSTSTSAPRAAALGVPRDRREALVETLLNLVGLAGRHTVRTERLSPGSRQLLGVAATLVHDPTLVLLDEPTRGLDERDRAKLWNLLHRLLDVGRTVVVSSRHLPELAAGCQEVAMLDGGKVLAQGAPGPLVAQLGGARRIRARLANGAVRTHTVADAAAQPPCCASWCSPTSIWWSSPRCRPSSTTSRCPIPTRAQDDSAKPERSRAVGRPIASIGLRTRMRGVVGPAVVVVWLVVLGAITAAVWLHETGTDQPFRQPGTNPAAIGRAIGQWWIIATTVGVLVLVPVVAAGCIAGAPSTTAGAVARVAPCARAASWAATSSRARRSCSSSQRWPRLSPRSPGASAASARPSWAWAWGAACSPGSWWPASRWPCPR